MGWVYVARWVYVAESCVGSYASCILNPPLADLGALAPIAATAAAKKKFTVE